MLFSLMTRVAQAAMLKSFYLILRSMAPAARKLKGGLRKMFTRHAAEESEDAVGSPSSDDGDESDDEADQPKQAPSQVKHSRDSPQDHVSHEGCDLHRSESPHCSTQQSHALEPSSESQATVMPKTVSAVPENLTEVVGPVLPTTLRSISEPIPSVSRVGEPGDRKEHDEPGATIQQLEPEVVVMPNHFNDKLPRELQLAVLKALVDVHEEEHQRTLRGECPSQIWSVRAAGKTRWVGRDKGLRELVKFTRVCFIIIIFPSG